MPFFHMDNKFTFYTTDGEDSPHSGEDLGKCQLENNIFLFFYNAIIPQNVMHLYAVYCLSSFLEVEKVTSQPLRNTNSLLNSMW